VPLEADLVRGLLRSSHELDFRLLSSPATVDREPQGHSAEEELLNSRQGTCPLTQRQLIEEYFIEHRTKLLDLAAFLDRLDRASQQDAADDFRLAALRRALQVLSSDAEVSRLETIQMILSDTRTNLLEQIDRKSAFGAYGGPRQERG
jgi:hypothetical protein